MDETSATLLNTKLQAIWNDHLSKDEAHLHPVYFRTEAQGDILFVGMNPSFNEKGLRKTIKGTEFETLDVSKYYSLSNSTFDISVSCKIDVLSQSKYLTFYKQHDVLAQKLGTQWMHLDLFRYRQTNQADFLRKVVKQNGELNPFGQDQFDLFLSALEITSPKIILVANAKASQIFKSKVKLDFSPDFGTYVTVLGGDMVPVFLSSMLTGQRALDTFSRERLYWHIHQAYSKRTL